MSSSSSARALELTLDEVVNLADENLEAMARMHRPTTSSRSTTKLQPRGSVPRGNGTSQPTGSNKETLEAKLDRKYEYMYRRTKLIDDKLKMAEKEQLEYKNLAEEQASLVETLLEDRKTSQKQILQLRESLASLTSKVNMVEKRALITSSPEHLIEKEKLLERESRQLKERETNLRDMEKMLATQSRLLEDRVDGRRRGQGPSSPSSSHRGISDTDIASIVDTVKKIVKKDFNSMVNDVVKSCAVEQARFLSKWAEQSKQSTSSRVDPEHDIMPAVEKEVARMITEFSKLKGRQECLEDKYRDLHSGVAIREKRAEDAHRRAIATYKKEINTVIDATGKRINDYLSGNSSSSKTVLELSMEIDELAQRTERQRSDLVRRIQDVQNIQNEHQQLIESLGWLSNQPWALEGEEGGAKGGPDTPLSVILSSKFRELNGTIDACSRNHDFLAQSVGALVKQLKSEVNDVNRSLMEHKHMTTGSMESVFDFNRKIKSKVNEVATSVASITKIREAVESLLMDVDLKSSNETEDSPQAKATSSALMKLGMRIQALEERLDTGGQPYSQHSLQQLGAAVGGGSQSDDVAETKNASQPHVLVYRKLQEEIQQEFARLQSEVEEALQVGWKEMGTRSVQASHSSVKAIEDSMQRVQGVVMSMHKEQRLLSERLQLLENNHQSTTFTTKTATTGSSSSSSSSANASHTAVQETQRIFSQSASVSVHQPQPSQQQSQATQQHPLIMRAASTSSTAKTTATTTTGGATLSASMMETVPSSSSSSTPVITRSTLHPSISSPGSGGSSTGVAQERKNNLWMDEVLLHREDRTGTDGIDVSSAFEAELAEAIQRLHVKKNQHRNRYLQSVMNDQSSSV